MSSALLSQTFGRIFSANLAAKWPWNIKFDLLGVIFTSTNAVCYVPLNVSLKVFDAAVSRPFFQIGCVPVQHGRGRLTGDDSAETITRINAKLPLPAMDNKNLIRWSDSQTKTDPFVYTCPWQNGPHQKLAYQFPYWTSLTARRHRGDGTTIWQNVRINISWTLGRRSPKDQNGLYWHQP